MTNTGYQITTDIFTLPWDDELKILYAPLEGFVSLVNTDAINLLADAQQLDIASLNENQKATLQYFEKHGLLNGEIKSRFKPVSKEYEPTRLTLFPTNQCNLRCIYCYASAGEEDTRVMDVDLAEQAVEFVIKNVKNKGLKHLPMGFHGGGEPLYPWAFIQKMTQYVKSRGKEEKLNVSVFSATNGLLNETQLEWIVEHFSSLNVSFDGLPHVQDYHRPLPNGKGSFEYVDRTMRFLDDHDFRYGLRGTVSDYNLELMNETVEFIAKNYKCRQVHLEPLFYCGRCKTSDTLSPDMERFAENFMKCEDKAAECGIELIYSGSHLNAIRNSFCGVSSDNFSITPDGYVTTCFECTTPDDPKSEYFFIGKIEKNGQVNIDMEKRNYLNTLTVEQLDYCQNCFAKWHCAGECAAKVETQNIKGPRGHDRCLLNRKLLENRIHRLINDKPVNIKKVQIHEINNNEGKTS